MATGTTSAGTPLRLTSSLPEPEPTCPQRSEQGVRGAPVPVTLTTPRPTGFPRGPLLRRGGGEPRALHRPGPAAGAEGPAAGAQAGWRAPLHGARARGRPTQGANPGPARRLGDPAAPCRGAATARETPSPRSRRPALSSSESATSTSTPLWVITNPHVLPVEPLPRCAAPVSMTGRSCPTTLVASAHARRCPRASLRLKRALAPSAVVLILLVGQTRDRPSVMAC